MPHTGLKRNQMNSKKAKKLRKIARAITIGKPVGETDKVYKRLKKIDKQ